MLRIRHRRARSSNKLWELEKAVQQIMHFLECRVARLSLVMNFRVSNNLANEIEMFRTVRRSRAYQGLRSLQTENLIIVIGQMLFKTVMGELVLSQPPVSNFSNNTLLRVQVQEGQGTTTR